MKLLIIFLILAVTISATPKKRFFGASGSSQNTAGAPIRQSGEHKSGQFFGTHSVDGTYNPHGPGSAPARH
ncbi:hypothetical protein Zmor_020268 [Zophobas morio]|uniref:Uncharacterized protein n=1 Tax=Zophobas morio TaxID=2755281 RepID=A0AA38I322_9CUCU|nr:hypothetical protein Zmor_020268 [Zophobas morio]